MRDSHDTSWRGLSTAELYDLGRSVVEDGDPARALPMSDDLENRRFSGAFELRALALQSLGDLDGAARALREGLGHAPRVWTMWQLLGNIQSDLGKPQDARESYERALACDGVWRESVVLNVAVLRSRDGDHRGALDLLEDVTVGDNDEAFGAHVRDLLLACRRELRGEVLPRGTLFDVFLDGPVRGQPACRFVQRVRVVAVAEGDILRFVREDLGEEYDECTIEEAEPGEVLGEVLAGVHWAAAERYVYAEGT